MNYHKISTLILCFFIFSCANKEDNKLFGSVTKLDIVKLLEENGITIDKKYIDLSSPIKTLGEHKVNIVFTKEMSGSFTLAVEKED